MIKVSDNYYVSSQISEKDLEYFKNEGFDLIVCNRPNGEEENQVDFELIQKPVSYTHLRAHETREDRGWRGGG